MVWSRQFPVASQAQDWRLEAAFLLVRRSCHAVGCVLIHCSGLVFALVFEEAIGVLISKIWRVALGEDCSWQQG